MKRTRLLLLLVLLTAAATGAWAQEPATPTYNVSVFDGKLNPNTWTGKAGEANGFGTMPLRGVAEGQNVTLKYQGRLKVKSVTAKLEEPVTLATPLTVEALTDGTITVTKPKDGMQYSLNGTAKTSDGIASITVKAGDKVAFYGHGTSIASYFRTTIGGSGDGFQCKVYGNIMSLVDEENFATATELTAENTFFMLFDRNTTLADASSLLLPATTLTSSCYGSMFDGCTALTAAPKLPATILASACYDSMFDGCTALTAAPELPATELADYCYYMMFNDCTGLTALPADLLQATKLFGGCYSFMFSGCTGLTAIPDNFLPATTMAEECYSSMFSGCTGLTAIPADLLPATTMANECYYGMFDGCTGLTAIPDNFLPATTMASECYKSMFEYCTGLTALPATLLPATTLAENCYKCMFEDCTGLTALPDNLLPASTLADSCYYRMFYGCTGLTALPATLLPASTLAERCYYSMFYGCTGLTAAPLLPATSLATGCYQQMFRDCIKLASVTCLATSNVVKDNILNWLKDAGTEATDPKLYVDPSMTKTDWSNGIFTVQSPPDVTLNETDDNSEALEQLNGHKANITLTRTLETGGWNTFAVPFSLTISEAEAMGITAVKELSGSSFTDGELHMDFADATAIEAGKPYMVMVDKDLVNPTFSSVTVSKSAVKTETAAVDFVPTLGKTLVTGPAGNEDNASAVMMLGADDKLIRPTVVNAPGNQSSYIKGFRAFFQLKGDAASARSFYVNLGDATAIENTTVTNDTNGDIYNLQGRKMVHGTSSNGTLPKGVYIVNGKKLIIK